MNSLRKSSVLLFLISALALTACPKKQTVVKQPETKPEPVAEAPASVPGTDEVTSEELSIHGKDFVVLKDIKTIYFNYDSDTLSEDARKILANNAEYLKQNQDVEVLSEGHCDDRGTISYNLALGQKRAAAVRNYYNALGLDPKRIGTLSYGKEKPMCVENTEECLAKNRRVETKIRIYKIENQSMDAQPNPNGRSSKDDSKKDREL